MHLVLRLRGGFLIFIQIEDENTFDIGIDPSGTVLDLKELIFARDGTLPREQRLMDGNVEMRDGRWLPF